jgi:hypothetical protein
MWGQEKWRQQRVDEAARRFPPGPVRHLDLRIAKLHGAWAPASLSFACADGHRNAPSPAPTASAVARRLARP